MLSLTPSHNVFLYKPVLSENMITRFLPPRWNEVLSVYHIKSYIFDNNMILSGANLSHDYFTSRIDRYVLFEDCPDLVRFYEDYFSILSNYCSSVSCNTGKIDRFRRTACWGSSQDRVAIPTASSETASTRFSPAVTRTSKRILTCSCFPPSSKSLSAALRITTHSAV